MAVASRWPYRECLRAASWRRSTSFGVRYSRSRRSAFNGRRGLTVRFTMVEGLRRVLGFFTGNAPYGKATFRIMNLLRKDVHVPPFCPPRGRDGNSGLSSWGGHVRGASGHEGIAPIPL